MFLLVSVRHVRAHPGEHQHGISIQISVSLGKTFLDGYLVYEIFPWLESWPGSLYMFLLLFPRFWTLSIERFWFLFWCILNGVTLKTSNYSRTFQTQCCWHSPSPPSGHPTLGKKGQLRWCEETAIAAYIFPKYLQLLRYKYYFLYSSFCKPTSVNLFFYVHEFNR